MAKRKDNRGRKRPRDAEAIPAAEFKAKSLEFVNRVREQHVEYVITRHGRPVAKLTPVDEVPASAIGFMQGTVLASGDIVSPDFDAWESGGAKLPKG